MELPIETSDHDSGYFILILFVMANGWESKIQTFELSPND